MAKRLRIATGLGKNQDLIVPFEIAWARQPDMSIHEQRVLLRVMEFCNAQLKGIRIADNLRQITPTDTGMEITMPVSDAFFSELTNKEVEDTLIGLSHRIFQIRCGKIWSACGYIEHPEVHHGTGMMSFGVYKRFWEVLLNFVSGFREIELNKALMLPSTYSLRFYMLVSGKTNPIYMSIEDFKQWLGIEDHLYRDSNGKHRIDNLENRVIKPAKEALDNSCPYTFTYTKVRENPRHPKSPVKGFNFTSVAQPKFRDPNLERNGLMARISTSGLVNEDIRLYLIANFSYTPETFKSHKSTIHKWQQLEQDPLLWLSKHRRAANDANNPIAYIFGSIKKRLEELENKSSGDPAPRHDDIDHTSPEMPEQSFIKGIASIQQDLLNKFRVD